MNEELQTVNSELKNKLENISSAHSDLRNLTAATEIGTLFLDEKLRIRMFTRPIAELFNITDSDIGRPLTDFTHRLRHDGVERDVRKVLQELVPLETEVQSTDHRWLMMRIRPYRTIEDRIAGAVVSFVDVSSLRGAEKRQMESEQRYRLLFDSIDQGFGVIEMIVDGNGNAVDYRFLEVNRAFPEQTGISEPLSGTMREIQPHQEALWLETYGRVATTREPERFEASGAKDERCFEVYAFPFGEPEARQLGVLFQDITERKRAENEREMLTQELSHRVKNTLAVVQGLASQTGRDATSVEEFREAFTGRINALANAHGLLLSTQWKSADMQKLVEATLRAHGVDGEGSVSVSGPLLQLRPKQGLGISLILHELATNAAKYGALTAPAGHVAINWQTAQNGEQRIVQLSWKETDGPEVVPPKRKGFGTRLFERACKHELHGSGELRFEPGGCVAEVRFPLE